MSQTANCETCGRPLGDTSAGVCPNCLLRSAIEQGAGQALAPLLPRLHYFGDYELLEEIARGGMGVVYRARQVSLERTVAVKMMRPGLLATEDEIRRFQAEAKTAAGLQHPNIVAIHEVGEFDGLHYFSMDFVDGPSLADLVRDRPLPAGEAARHMRTLAAAVEYAHGRGILHRDLKPSNILLDSAGRPHITDFGLARPLDANATVTMSGAVVGTPAYMPPEQAAGRHERLGPASDVYSLGAVLYELLTGRPPFHGRTQVETVNQVLDTPPVLPRKINAAIPRGLEAICLRCLEKEPGRRYGSAADLVADLDRFLEGRPVEARRSRSLRPVWTLLAAAILLVSLFAVLRTNRVRTVPPSRPQALTPPPAIASKPNPMPPVQPAAPSPAPRPTRTPPPAGKPAAVPIAISVSPDRGAGYQQLFVFRYAAPAGAKVGSVQIAFHEETGAGPRDCNLFVDPDSGDIGLQYNPGAGPNLRLTGAARTLGRLENRVCAVDLAGTAATRHDGDIEVSLPLTFSPGFAGPKQIRSRAFDQSGNPLNTSRGLGTWVVGPPHE